MSSKRLGNTHRLLCRPLIVQKQAFTLFLLWSGISILMQRYPAAAALTMKHRILCYGDSLTAGTSPPLFEMFPYAPHLEKSLATVMDPPPVIRWMGMPGWTATAMVNELDSPQAGLRTTLRRVQDSGNKLSLAIILAGSNDLAYETSADPIIEAICNLHKASHEGGVPTVAISIPPSGWQSRSKAAASMAQQVNNELQKWCSETDMATFVPCPIQSYQGPSDENFAPDGLHFTPIGFETFGKGLTIPIHDVLTKLTNENNIVK